MSWQHQNPGPADFLHACEWIDCDAATIQNAALQFSAESATACARRCFEFVRDQIEHSSDFQRDEITCRASDVLHTGTGFCYAKAHLLCALLRALSIPAGLCYQRLAIEEGRFCIHGLVAVYLEEHGGYRCDPRGNRPGVEAQFCPPQERLAFPISESGERDLDGIFRRPLESVTQCLISCDSWQQVCDQLPDV